MQKSVGELIKEENKFIVPYYQRGYRWGKVQIFALLNDLFGFYEKTIEGNINYKYYSLQPLVVKYDKNNEIYRLIDGQQRLTTICLILSAFENFSGAKEKLKFNISYDREGSKKFLYKIKDDDFRKKEAKTNIDFTYMANAYECVETWINDKKFTDDNIDDFMLFLRRGSSSHEDKDINKNIRFIWYVLPDSEDEFSTFIRLNIGKIPLTNAELIKSFILQNIDMKNKEKRFEVSKEWDDIEYSLQKNDFFGFLSKSKLDTRIELLFQIFLRKEEYKEFELYDLFVKYYDDLLLKNSVLPKDKQKKPEKIIKDIWKKIKEIFHTTKYWFEDREFYHLIGYLVSIDENIINIWDEYDMHEGKDSFKFSVIKKIYTKLQVNIENDHISFHDDMLNDLYYKHKDISRVLLLFNVITLINSAKDTYMKFSFDLYNSERWSIEHINPQTDQIKNNIRKQEFILELKTLNNEEVNLVLLKLETKEIDRDQATEKLEDIFRDKDIEKDNDNIINLTLLSSGINSSLKNNFFPIKRKMIIDKDKNGEFIPIATKNLFLKYYSDFTKDDCNMFKWRKSDGGSYLRTMNDQFIEFFKGIEDGN